MPVTSLGSYDLTVNGNGKGACEGDSGAQATAALKLANTASLVTLDDAVGLDRRAAEGIVAARPFSTLQALAAVPLVGASALTRLRDH